MKTCPSRGALNDQTVVQNQKRMVPNDGLKHYMVGTATFVQCTTISEFNKLIKKAGRLCSPQVVNQPNDSFSHYIGTNFLTDGKNNIRIDVTKNGASMLMTITIESIIGTDLNDNVRVMNQLFTRLSEVCEALPFPEDKKTGKVRKGNPTLDHIDEPQEQTYDPCANAGGDNSGIVEKIKIMKAKEPIIDITKEFVKEKFKEYNELYFNGELKMPIINLIHSYTLAGQFWAQWGMKNSKLQLIRKEIKIVDNIIWTESTFRDVLVHEIIHYYVETKKSEPKREGDFQHWGLFRKMKIKLNWRYGLHITNRHNLTYKNEICARPRHK